MSDEQRVVAGGKAHITGIHEKGPMGPALKGERLREVRDKGANGPSDGWYAVDGTPKDQNGVDFGPMPKSEEGAPVEDQRNPEHEGVPSWDGSDTHQTGRLTWDAELTAGTADLVHEYANHGWTPRIKTVGARGRLVNLRFIAAGGVEIPLRPPTLNIGRQEAQPGKAGKGKRR